MGKAGRWLRSILTGKKDKEKARDKSERQPSLPPAETRHALALATPAAAAGTKEKRRWSFRRPAAANGKDLSCPDQLASMSAHGFLETRVDPDKHAVAVAVATAAAAAQDAAAVIRLTATGPMSKRSIGIEEAAAIKIQSVFRSYLARKALCALRGLVKLQALVRGHLVRKQASNTLRCMQALVAVQERARAERMRVLEEEKITRTPRQQPPNRRSPQHPRFRQPLEMTDRNSVEDVKIVEVDNGEIRGMPKCAHSCYSTPLSERMFSRYSQNRTPSKADLYQKVSPTPSALTDMSTRTYSGRFEEFSFATAQSSPQHVSTSNTSDATKQQQHDTYLASHDHPLFPNYMANTESSRAKARSQSAPKQRPAADAYERQQQSSRRRASLEPEARNMIPRGVRMQRSSSQAGSAYPWSSVKLDKSNVSLKDSECGSTSTVVTSTTYCRSVAAHEAGMP